MSIYASEFLKWLRIFGVTTGGGPAPTGALLAINNLDDVLNSTTSIENLGLGRPGILILTDADFAGGGGTYVLTNPPPIYISMSATSPGRVLQLPPQNQPTSLQASEDIRLLTGPTSEPININNGAGTLVHQVLPDSAWQAIPNNRSTIAGAWEFLGIVMTINGSHTGNVNLASDPQTLYVSNSGDNVNGNGSILFPYATLSHALAVATPSPTTPYEIIMQMGVYTETNLTFKANVLIEGNQSSLTVSGAISLDVDWGSGGFLYIQNFTSLTLPAVNTFDFTAVFASFALFVFRNNILSNSITLDVKGAIFICSNNFGFANEPHYIVNQCYGAVQGGASGDIEITDVGNFSVSDMTEIGNLTATWTQSGTMIFFHESSKALGNVLYHSTGNGTLVVQEKSVGHAGSFSLDNGLSGGSVQFSADVLDKLPTLVNGATYSPTSIGDAIRANAYFSPSNYTPQAGPPGEWVADSLTGNLAGIDQALASGGSIPPAYAEAYFQANTQDTVFAFPATAVKVRATTYNSGELAGFTQSNGTFTYTGAELRTVQLTAMITATYQGTVQNTSFYITKNGVPLAKSKQTTAIGFITPSPEPLPIQATSQIVTGDTFEVWVSNDDNTNAITVYDMNFNISGMSGSSANAGVPPSYAEMFFQDNATPTPIANVNIPTKIVATYNADMLKDFTHSAGTLTYQGSVSKVFVLDADLTATYAGTAQNTSFYITVNGTVVAKSKQKTFIGPVTPADMPNPCHAVVTLNLGSTVEVWVENNDNANDPTIVDFNLFVHSIDLIGTSPNVSGLEQIIWVNNLNGADTNQGSIDSPMKTYEAARLLAKARGASINTPYNIRLVGKFSIAGTFMLSPFINVIGDTSYSTIVVVSGNVVLDPAWGTTSTPFTAFTDVDLVAGGISLVYPAFQNGSFLRFQNSSLQLGSVTIVGSGTNVNAERIVFDNCNTDILTAGPTFTATNVNLLLLNTQIPNAVSVSVTSTVTNATCIVQAAQGPTGNMTFSRTSTGVLNAYVNACNTKGKTLTINAGAIVHIDSASYGATLALTGGATLAQLNLLSQGDGIDANVNFTPTNYTRIPGALYGINTLTANLAGIDAALATAGGGVIPAQMIFVDGLNGNDSNTGSISSPLLTYEAARILAVSRNPQYGSGQTIVVMTTLSIPTDMTISAYVSLMGMNKYSTIIGVNGAILLDASWGLTPFAEAEINNIAFVADHIDLTFNNYTDSSIIRFSDCSFQLLNAGPTATFTGSNGSGNTNCETVIFQNCSLDLQPGIPEPQFISDNVNVFLFDTAVTNATVASVTSATIAATLIIQDAIANLANVTVTATSTGTLTTRIAGCNPMGATLTVNGTANTVNIDADSYNFASFVFSGGASYTNIIGGATSTLYIDAVNGNDNNSGTINYPMQTYEAARLKAVASGASSNQVWTIIVIGNHNIAGDLTLSANVNLQGISSPYTSGFSLSGGVVIDPDWGLSDFAYTQVRDMYMYVGTDYIFTFTHPQVFSFLKFVNVAMNTGGFITVTGSGTADGTETITFENCTNDIPGYADGFIAENVHLFLINTDISSGSVTVTASSADAVNYQFVTNNARFYTNDIHVKTNNASTLTTFITACNTMGRTLNIDGVNNTVNVDSTSYMFTLSLNGGATLANLVLPTKTDGMTNSSYSPSRYTPTGDTLYGANTLTGNLKGIDNALPKASGSATLSIGTVTVLTSSVAAGDFIGLTATARSGVPGNATVTINPGVSFTITSDSISDATTYKWKNLGA